MCLNSCQKTTDMCKSLLTILTRCITITFNFFNTDPPLPPNNINISSCTNTTAEVTWTQPNYSSQFCSIASYSINTTTNNSIINTTDTSLSLAFQSEGIYCISIASIDTANRTGNYSEPDTCFEITGKHNSVL